MTENETIAACERLNREMGSLLAGNPPELQGAVLVDLIAIWLKEHRVEGGSAATAELRRDILDGYLRALWDLVGYYDAKDGLIPERRADG